MIEKDIRDYLVAKFPSTPVLMEQPESIGDEFILIELTGSRKRDKVALSTIAVQSYSGSLYGAATLSHAVVAAMEDIDIESVASCKLNAEYNFTDTATKRYRYQAVFDLTHY